MDCKNFISVTTDCLKQPLKTFFKFYVKLYGSKLRVLEKRLGSSPKPYKLTRRQL